MSKLRVNKLKAEDLVVLLDKKARSYVGPVLTEAQIAALEASAHSYSLFIDEKITLCGGVMEYWTNRGEAWAVLDPECKPHFVAVTAAAKRFLNVCPVNRIEAAVDVDFKAGNRWVKSLGFQFEATCRKFLPDGRNAFLYSRVRD